ncbi:MAG: SOS response-associated peptidase [Planctomycetota bacterium]|nr:SOS response-associated peptidase [Planctomycetota bacterium]
MCGRYALMSDPELLVELFALASLPVLKPRYNIAPTQQAPIVRAPGASGKGQGGDEGRRRLDFLHWGLIPSWAKDPSMGARMINARSETAAEKPAFRSAMRRRRCLVPADAFYEWQKRAGGKQPYCIRMRDGSPFAFAGLWERWEPPEGEGEETEPVESFTILTTTPNAVMKKLHDRMPVIIPREAYDLWLDETVQDPAKLEKLLSPVSGGLLEVYPISRRINSPRHDDPACLDPAEEVDDDDAGDADEPTLFS